MVEKKALPIHVASWPGRGHTQNSFLNVFLDGLEAADCEVESLNSIEALQDALKIGPDILLLHWAERIFWEARNRWHIPVKINRLLRAISQAPPHTKVVWLVHNLEPHNPRIIQRIVWPGYMKALANRVDAFMTLAPATVDQVRASIPELSSKPGYWVWHPAYPDAVLSQPERAAVRTKYGFCAENRVLGFLGQIRPNKGIDELLTTFCETADHDLRLIISGSLVSDGLGVKGFERFIRDSAKSDDRITLQISNLSNAEFRGTLGACDLIVAPFKSYLHSGSLVHALCSGVPVLTPKTPFSVSYQQLFGAERLHLYNGKLQPQLLSEISQGQFSVPDLSSITGDHVGQMTEKIFRKIIQNV